MALSYRMWKVKNNDRIITVMNKAASFGRETPTTTMHSLWWGKDGGDSKRPIGLIAALIIHLKCKPKIQPTIKICLNTVHIIRATTKWALTANVWIGNPSADWYVVASVKYFELPREKCPQVVERVQCFLYDAHLMFCNANVLEADWLWHIHSNEHWHSIV